MSIGSFGLDIEEYQKYKVMDINWNSLGQMRNNFLRKYYYELIGNTHS
jgi:hypothetical protein